MSKYDTKADKGSGSTENKNNKPAYVPESLLDSEVWQQSPESADRMDYAEAFESNITPVMSGIDAGVTVVFVYDAFGDSDVLKRLARFDTPVFAVDSDVVMLLDGRFENDIDGMMETGDAEYMVKSGRTTVQVPIEPDDVLCESDELLSVESPVVEQFGGSIGYNMPTWGDVRENIAAKATYSQGVNLAADLLLDEYDIVVTQGGEGDVLVYDDESGVFAEKESMLQTELSEKLGDESLNMRRNEILNEIRARESIADMDVLDAGEYDETLVCVDNGVLNFDAVVSDESDDVLMEHSPEYKFTYSIDARFDPDVESDVVSGFLSDITRREEDAKTLEELVAMVMLPDNRFEKFGMLFGPGANGKTTYADMIRGIIGTENVSSKSLQNMATTDNNFPYYSVYDKLANICAELPEKKIKNTKPIKELSSSDVIDVEPKGVDSFSALNSATQIYLMNDPPVIESRKNALARRIVPVELPYQFTPFEDDGKKQADPDLGEKLSTDDARTELLLLAVDAYERLYESDDVSLPESYDERLERYNRASDTIYSFSLHGMEASEGERVPKDVIYTAYSNYCRDKRTTSVAQNSFFKKLSQKTDIPVDTCRPTINGERVFSLKNMSLTDVGVKYVPDEMRDEYGLWDDDESDDVESDDSCTNRVALPDLDALRSPDEFLEIEVLSEVSTSPNGPSIKFNVECTESEYRSHLICWENGAELDVVAGGTYRLYYVSDTGESVVLHPNMSEVVPVDVPDESGSDSDSDDDGDGSNGDSAGSDSSSDSETVESLESVDESETVVESDESGSDVEMEWSEMSAKESVLRVLWDVYEPEAGTGDELVADDVVLAEWESRTGREKQVGVNALGVLFESGDVMEPLGDGRYKPLSRVEAFTGGDSR